MVVGRKERHVSPIWRRETPEEREARRQAVYDKLYQDAQDRIERERQEVKRRNQQARDAQLRRDRQEARARRYELEQRRQTPEHVRNYENWIMSYGTKRQKRDLQQRRSVGDHPSDVETRAWERTQPADGRIIGRPEPEPEDRHRQHQRRWLDQQEELERESGDGRLFGGGTEGLIGEQNGAGDTGRGRGGAGGRSGGGGDGTVIGGGQIELGPAKRPPPDTGKDEPRDGKLW